LADGRSRTAVEATRLRSPWFLLTRYLRDLGDDLSPRAVRELRRVCFMGTGGSSRGGSCLAADAASAGAQAASVISFSAPRKRRGKPSRRADGTEARRFRGDQCHEARVGFRRLPVDEEEQGRKVRIHILVAHRRDIPGRRLGVDCVPPGKEEPFTAESASAGHCHVVRREALQAVRSPRQSACRGETRATQEQLRRARRSGILSAAVMGRRSPPPVDPPESA